MKAAFSILAVATALVAVPAAAQAQSATMTTICALVVDQNLNVGATFARAFNLSVSSSNKGRVSSDDGAIGCGGTNKQGTGSCSAKFAEASLVTLTATPPAGGQFLSWAGACSEATPTCQVVITRDTSVQANFSK